MNALTKIKQFFTVTLWQDIPEQANAVWRGMINGLRVGYIVIRELAKGELNLRAMSLVFTTLLSLVPLIAVSFSVLKAFGVHNQIEPFLLGLLEPLGPKSTEITTNIIGFVENIKVGVLGTLGVATLFYTIIALIQKIEKAFNFVWRVKRARTLARRFTDYLSVVMIGPVLVVTALGVAASVLNHDVALALRSIEPFGTIVLAITKLLPYLMIIAAFTFLYKFIPNTSVKLGPAISGATVAGVLWITVGTMFATFVASSSKYTAIYSSFAILFFFMIWLYLAWLILLTGSQVAFYLQHPKLVRYGDDYQLSPRLKEKEGLAVMVLVAKQFLQWGSALSLQELEKKTALTGDVLLELVTTLEAGGLLVELAGDESRYQPGQDIAEIKVAKILHCLRSSREHDNHPQIPIDERVEQLFGKLDDAQLAILDNLSLRQLVTSRGVE